MTGYLTTAQVAARLGVIPRRVLALVRAGRLPAVHEETPRGPVYWYAPEDVEAYQPLPQGWPKGRKRTEK